MTKPKDPNNRKQQNFWTETEMELLTKKYPYMRCEALAEQLPRHTIGSIYAKARSLGLRAYLTTDDVQPLAAIGLAASEIGDLLGRSRNTIYHHLKRLNS